MYVSAAGTVSVTYPWFANDNSDELAHVDMIWRIWNGDLPKASDGLRYQPFIDQGGANVYQRAAGHPPLYHALMAPFMGPLLNQGKWQYAIAVGRALNVGIGILCILAFAWAGWLVGGNRRAMLAVAIPAMGVLAYRFTRINTDLSMDGLLTLWSSLTLINLYYILKNRLSRKYLMWLAILMAAGMATKISFGIYVALGLAVVMFVSYMQDKDNKKQRILLGSYRALFLIAFILLSVGWYYYFQNYRSSGSFITPISGELPSHRVHQSYLQILGGHQFWSLFYARLSYYPGVSIMITTLGVAGYFVLNQFSIFKAKIRSLDSQVALLMTLAFIGTSLTQLKFAHPTGAINFRYLLQALLPIGLFLSYGLLQFKQLRGQLVALSATLLAGTTILSIRLAPTTEGLLPGVTNWEKDITKIYGLLAKNGIPMFVETVLLGMFIIGSLSLMWSMYQLSKINKT